MTRIISLLLSLVLILSTVLFSFGCAEAPSDPPDSSQNGSDETEPSVPDSKIISPAYKDYKRGTIDFSEIEYKRPAVDEVIGAFEDASDIIEANAVPYNEQLDAVYSLENGYVNLTTMYTYASIRNSQDKTDDFWREEYELISKRYPDFMRAVEALFVSAASSPYAKEFEKDYFGDGLIEKYKDGARLNDTIIELLLKETELENEYSALSGETVRITVDGNTDSYDAHLSALKESVDDERAYEAMKRVYDELYKEEYSRHSVRIFTELIKVRRLIADAYGYESYATLAYSEIYHDYSREEAVEFFKSIARSIVPVYYKLSYSVFQPYTNSYNGSTLLDKADAINGLYYLYKDMNKELFEAYCYMLQHGLYDYENKSVNRFEASFTTYLEEYNAPFIFISADGSIYDKTTLAHEFGHFFDNYKNYGADTSLDAQEISSTALELLTVLKSKDDLNEAEYDYLYYSTLDTAMNIMVYQAFLALFEHYIYDLKYDDISEKSITAAMQRAALEMNLSISLPLETVVIPHTVLYPFYVQSYAVSIASSLEILILESEEEGAGIEAYMKLLDRSEEKELEEMLRDAGLTSPFKKNFLIQLADKIHFTVLGSHFHAHPGIGNDAA